MSSSRSVRHVCRAAFSHASRQLTRLPRPPPPRTAIVSPSNLSANVSANVSAYRSAHRSAHSSPLSPAYTTARSPSFPPLPLSVRPLIRRPVTSRLITPTASCSFSNFSVSSLSRLADGATISRSLKPSLTSSAITSTPIPSSALSSVLSSVLSARRLFGSKIKVKPYSSLKRRFKLLANGEYKRWRAGKRHNASTKTKKQRRQLRQPSVVPPGLKQPMRYLGFKR